MINEVQWEALKLLWNGFVYLSAIGFWIMAAGILRSYRESEEGER